jgi:uncharacterized Fe-S cluster-containing radical SAM superfamily protein
MLFLFNDVVFDLGDARETAKSAGLSNGFSEPALINMRIGRVIKLVREAMFDEHYLPRTNTEVATFLAAMVAWKTDEANALLAVTPKGATDATMVQVRLASVSLVAMTQLYELQGAGRLSSHVANLSVWRHAPQRMQA